MRILRVTAIWCPECAIMKFRWQEVLKRWPNLEVVEADFDKEKDLKEKYRIQKASTFIFFDDQGREIFRSHGLLEVEELDKLIRDYEKK